MTHKPWVALIVDDSFDDREVLATTLEYYGVIVYRASSLSECLKSVESTLPDVVITDLAMPDADGWAVLSAIRGNISTSSVPVIAVTAYDSPKLAQQAKASGFDGYMPKPIDPTTFVQYLETILNG